MTNEASMKPANPRILTINGGSSSIKFALFEASDPLQRILEGGIERIGSRNAAGVISAAAGRVTVRVIRTDEEIMIAKTVCRVLGLG